MDAPVTSMNKEMTPRGPKRAASMPPTAAKDRYPIMLPVAKSAAFTASSPKPIFMLGRITVYPKRPKPRAPTATATLKPTMIHP